jgi:hypothetical protein
MQCIAGGIRRHQSVPDVGQHDFGDAWLDGKERGLAHKRYSRRDWLAAAAAREVVQHRSVGYQIVVSGSAIPPESDPSPAHHDSGAARASR